MPDQKHWKRAGDLAARGILSKEADVFPGGGAFVVTEAGVNAYNAVASAAVKEEGDLAEQSAEKGMVIEAPPNATLDDLVEIIKRAGSIAPDAYWFESYDPETGDVNESLTLCEAALDKRIEQLGDMENESGQRLYGYGQESAEMFYLCDDTGALLSGTSDFDVETAYYCLTGFAWRRENQFAMTEKDWAEARAYIAGLDWLLQSRVDSVWDAVSVAGLKARIVESCFLPDTVENDTGIWNPGANCWSKMDELFHLFDFMKKASRAGPRGP